ncbi:MAG: ATP-dependent exonuclease SbcCD, C subunit-like protein [Desulfosarcina sp.]|nr:ATP-dependent exonuclease SbcCD, C subunit-like protein [Desulfobacterales bacterium]
MQRAIDFATSDERAGFRLIRFEVLNWGTFHKHIWTLPSEGRNSLLTGDIGSGKSTLVDGLITLLVPPQKILYNKAAGAASRERSLRSYVHGYFKSEKDDDTLAAKSIALRDDSSFSVLLACFSNEGFKEQVALAQVFWTRDQNSPPDRFYVVADRELTLSRGFSNFGRNIANLKKRLGKERGVKIFDSFSRYATDFRRRMGIENPQALDLFYQTVSMKSVGNLTDFVRRHMLEAPPVQERLDSICRQFDDLNRAHEAVLKARQQVEKLAPIATESQRFRQLERSIADLKQMRGALHAFFAQQKISLLVQRLQRRTDARDKLSARIASGRQGLEALRSEQRRLERAISESGGGRLEELAEQIRRLTAERRRIAAKAESYKGYCTDLKFSPPSDEADFANNRRRADQWKQALVRQQDDMLNRQVEHKVRLQEIGAELETLETEIKSLQERQTNIPSKSLGIRGALCEAVAVPEAALPFVGELLQVKEAAADWEGAIERLLHNFGLSLLVPNAHYAKVAQYVDATHLAGRLVYFKASVDSPGRAAPAGADSLLRKIDIKPDTRLYDWLAWELGRRFDYTCCRTTEQFRRLNTAVTSKGQMKSGGIRHEKDDRYRIDDRSRYVLGWNNREKIRVLQSQRAQLKTRFDDIVALLQQLDQKRKRAEAVRDRLQSLLAIEGFVEIHWQPLALRIEGLADEKRQIEDGSDVLRTLQGQLEKTLAAILKQDEQLGCRQANLGKILEGLAQAKRLKQTAEQILTQYDPRERKERFARLTTMRTKVPGDKKITVENCDAAQTRMREWLQQRIENEDDKSRRSAAGIIRRMQEYKGLYPAETHETDAAIEALGEFIRMLTRLMQEDLPRHEQRFKNMLNEGTIQSIALFQAKLESELGDIRDKIDIINTSLSAIDYSEGAYIVLVADPSRDVEIREFRQDLRACLGETLTGREDEAYSEHKFLQVKALIGRFTGRTGYTEQDRRWTRKVTDVRNWLLFSVSERWREDDREKEFYSDTAGKSGGQKEKLAYTILASALLYQFGLKFGQIRSRSFRFVMIDEAFGRGSDESTRYALELFRKLNLQLLIVTPLQKINIIEDYVRAVHYIHNEGGCNSMIRNLTIEQYREEKARYREAAT